MGSGEGALQIESPSPASLGHTGSPADSCRESCHASRGWLCTVPRRIALRDRSDEPSRAAVSLHHRLFRRRESAGESSGVSWSHLRAVKRDNGSFSLSVFRDGRNEKAWAIAVCGKKRPASVNGQPARLNPANRSIRLMDASQRQGIHLTIHDNMATSSA